VILKEREMSTTDVDVKVEKDIEVSFEFNFESNVDIKLEKEVEVDVKIEAKAEIDGNIAIATFSAEAIGKDTFAEADVHVLAVENVLSSVDGVLIAAVT
jgi:hypothetical protein